MTDVFISYKAEDRRRVQPLVQALQADGLSVWWDEHIGAGDAWRETIEKQLDTARCVLVVWSKRSVGPEGRFVRDEASRAQLRGVYVPVLIDAVKPPLGFGESQATSLRGWRGDPVDPSYQAVLASVWQISGKPIPVPVPRLTGHGPVSRRAFVGGGAVAAAAVVGVGGWTLLKPSSASARSIAVLPFANLSGDAGQAYFSDGIAEELRGALARLAGLKVVGRTSSEAVRNDDAETAARKLGVANILTGSVRQSPSAIRVSAQLIDGRNGMEHWSQSYDRRPGDAIKVQTEIAENVARSLTVALGAAAGAALAVGGTENAAAQNFVLQAANVDDGTRAGTERAIQLLDEALRLDPNYADAYARKALYMGRLGNSFGNGSEEWARLRGGALQNAIKGVRLAPNHDRAHYALAYVYQSYLQVGRALAEYRRALELAPGVPAFLGRYSFFIARVASPSEALQIADKAIELEPLDPNSYGIRAARLFDARRYTDALRFAEDTERASPDLFDDPLLLGDCFLMLGKGEEALRHYSELPLNAWERITGEALVHARSGDAAGAEKKLLRMQQLFADVASYQYGQIYAQLGEGDLAIAALERAWTIRDGGLLSIRIDEMLDPLRRNPRLDSIIKRMQFPGV